MKHTSIFLFAVVAAICSCSKDIIDRTAEDSGNLSITALGTKTVLDGTSVNWTSNDVLVVFDNENTGVNFTTTADKTSYATFTTSNWTGKTPVYASCSQAGADAACSSGILTVKLDPAQVVKDKSTYAENASASVGIVSGNVGEYTISEMKNVQGLIRFSLKTGFVGSISVEAVNGEAIAGFVDVDYSKIAGGESAFWTATPGKKQSSTITLTPDGNAAKDGLFDAGVYYVSVLPQTYAKGLRFVVMDKGGDTLCSRTVGSETGLSIARSKIVKLDGNLDNIDTLPETISL